MVSFSVWHGLITLLVLFLYLGLPALAIAKENSEIRRNRKDFFLRIAAGVGVLLFFGTISVLLGGDEETNKGPAFLFYCVIAYPHSPLITSSGTRPAKLENGSAWALVKMMMGLSLRLRNARCGSLIR